MRARSMSRIANRTPMQDIAAESGSIDSQSHDPAAIPRSFTSEITGGWIIRPECTLVQYVIDRFEGDATWFGCNWITDGTAVLRLMTSDRKNILRWSVDYHYETDTLAWVCGTESAIFEDAGNPASPIQCQVNAVTKMIMLIVKSDVQLGKYVLGRGSHLSVVGLGP